MVRHCRETGPTGAHFVFCAGESRSRRRFNRNRSPFWLLIALVELWLTSCGPELFDPHGPLGPLGPLEPFDPLAPVADVGPDQAPERSDPPEPDLGVDQWGSPHAADSSEVSPPG